MLFYWSKFKLRKDWKKMSFRFFLKFDPDQTKISFTGKTVLFLFIPDGLLVDLS